MTELRQASDRTSIRRAGPDDRPVAQAISKDAFDIYLAMWNDVPRPGRMDLTPYIERGEVWLLEDDGEPVALTVLEPRPDYLHIGSLAVRRDRQGRGHATRLLAFAAEQAKARGFGRLGLDVNDHMVHSVAVYRHHGFVETRSWPHRSRPGQMMLAMVKQLTG
jgi:ribosomal protein S18 acetylase RimI-like enzyme